MFFYWRHHLIAASFLFLLIFYPYTHGITNIGQPYQVRGLFSSCFHNTNRTLFNHQAEYHLNAADSFYNGKNISSYLSRYIQYKFIFTSVDVCENETLLASYASEMLLGRRNVIQEPVPLYRNRNIKDAVYQPTILLCLTFLPTQMYTRLAEILSTSNIVLVNMKEKISYDFNKHVSQIRFVNTFDEILDLLKTTLNLFHWNQIDLVRIDDENSSFKEFFLTIENTLSKQGMCLNVEVVHYNESDVLQRLIERILYQSKVIILIGEPKHQDSFARSAMLYANRLPQAQGRQRYWVMVDHVPTSDNLYKSRYDTFISLNPGGPSDLELAHNVSRFFYSHFDKNIESSGYAFEYTLKMMDGFYVLYYHFRMKQWLRPSSIRDFRSSFVSSLNRVGLYVKVNGVNKAIFDGAGAEHPVHKLSNLKGRFHMNLCDYRTCLAGQEYVFSTLYPPLTEWKQSFKWICQKCTPGWFKSNGGNHDCKPCPIKTFSSDNGSLCLDVYTNSKLTLKYMSMKISCFGCATTCMVNIVVALIFCKHRHSPLVASIDFELTMIHISCSTLMSTLFCVFFLLPPGQWVCLAQLATFCLFYTPCIAAVLVRYNRIFKAFYELNLTLSKHEKNIDNFGRYVYVCGVTGMSCLLLPVLMNQNQPSSVAIESDETLLRHVVCNTNYHFNVLIGFTLILQASCFVQVFRSRNLPNTFKDVMGLVYGSFVISLVFLVMYPIKAFQKNPEGKQLVLLISVLLNNFIFVNFCYTNRAYLIVFKPEVNSVRHVKNQITQFTADKNRIQVR